MLAYEESVAGDVLAELRALRGEVRQLRKEVAALSEAVAPPVQRELPLPAPDPFEQLVTLDQAAALVRRSKRTLERYRFRGLPKPVVLGRRGRPSLWAWPAIRPWLEQTFGFRLPERFPGHPA